MPRWLKLIGRVVGVLLLVIVVGAALAYGVAGHRIGRKYDVAATPLTVPIVRDSATIARGHHLVLAIGKCVDCHGENMAGTVVINDKAFGHLSGANLTGGNGSSLAQYTDAEVARVIRRGVKRDGTSLLFMPVTDFSHFSDPDVAAIIAYLRSLTPVDHVGEPQVLGPIARMLILGGKTPVVLPASHVRDDAPHPTVPAGVTVQYGEYLAHVGGCFGCHGDHLGGGPVPGGPPEWPPARNLTPAALGAWTEADFTRVLREGLRPDGHALSAAMPWKYTRYMTDDEIRAVWMFLQTVPPVHAKS